MDNTNSVRWVRRLVAVMRESHAHDSWEWRRRIEPPPKPDPGPPLLARPCLDAGPAATFARVSCFTSERCLRVWSKS